MSIITKALEKAERERASRREAAHREERELPAKEKEVQDRPAKKRSAGKPALISGVLFLSVAIGSGIFLLNRMNGTDIAGTTPERTDTLMEPAEKEEPAGTAEKERKRSTSLSLPLSFLRKDRNPIPEEAPSLPELNGIM
ncbi:MAG: hypothetical protein GF392_04335, partial [Candidatus Omnitrophica bacterium]|nr:hypothetical protein [Candidatus Omnitrophota bacterium]